MTASLLRGLRFHNPVLSKDLRTRMRGAKAFLVQGAYVGILVLMIGLTYLNWWESHHWGASPLLISSRLGRTLYLLVFETQVALIVLITPALTAGTITLEREQRTYDLLACTRLSPRTILVGKLLSGWLFVVMLLTCSLPMAALCLMFGGVSVGEIGASYFMLCVFALLFGSVGIFCSALVARSVTAMALTYGAVFAYLLGTFALEPMQQGFGRAFNPFGFVADSTEPIRMFGTSFPPWLPGAVVLPLMSALAMNWAMTRLPHFVVDRALVMRLLTAVLAAALVALAAGGGGLPFGLGKGLPVVITAATALLVSAVFFGTGALPVSRPRSLLLWVISGLDPRRMFSGQLRGGWSYLILLAAVFVGSLRLASILAGGHPAPNPGRYFGRYAHSPATLASPTIGGTAALHLLVLLGAVLLCYSALGVLGAAAGSRRAGIFLVVSFLLVEQVVPGIMWLRDIAFGLLSSGDPDYTLYLAPYVGIATIIEPSVLKTLPKAMRPPAALPIWEVTAMIYLLKAGFFFLLAEVVYYISGRRAATQPGLGPAAQSEA